MSDRARGSVEDLQGSPGIDGPVSDGTANGPNPRGLEGPTSEGRDRRSSERIEVTWSVDCATEETFLYASITNISAMGIFVSTTEPLPVGIHLTLRFAPPGSGEAFILRGIVQWVNAVRPLHDNPNPGMGICFTDLTAEDRERIVEVVHTIAYVRDPPSN